MQLPGIAELSLGPATTIPAQLDTGCHGLPLIHGEPLPLRVQAAVLVLLAGDYAAAATPCDASELTPGAGTHRITTTAGAESGLQVDRIVLGAYLLPLPAAAVPPPRRGPDADRPPR